MNSLTATVYDLFHATETGSNIMYFTVEMHKNGLI